MRANLLVVLLVLLLGGGASLLLIPRGGELALQKFRDNDYESARADYEKRFAAGDRSATTVIPLTKLNLAAGEVEGAIALMEDFVVRAPKSVDGWELLSRLYQDAQRQGDYLESLRQLAGLRGNPDTYRELAYLAGFQGRLDVQTEALLNYCERRPADLEVQQELAALLAAQGDHAGAVEWLIRADDQAKGAIDANSRELLMGLLNDLDRETEAFQRAQRWLGENPTVSDMIGLASQLSVGGRPDLGLRLLEPQAAKPGRALALELTVIDLQLATGRTDDARARLSALKDPVDDVTVGRLLALQMNAGLGRLALTTARGRELKLIPGWVLSGLAEAAFRDRDRAYLDRLVGELGEGFLEERPVLAANIALGRGDAAAAVRWASRGLADARQPLSERLAAVRILALAGKRADAVAGFDRLPLGDPVPDDTLGELSSMFLDLDRAPAGLAWFETRRRALPSPAADTGWVRLAAKAGDPAAVVAWLDAHLTPLSAELLQDIATFASERGAGPLALKAAERVFAMAPTARSRFALANALLAAGRGAEALPHLTLLLPGGGTEVETAYVTALDAAGRTEELTRFLSAKLAKGGLSDEEERAIVFALLDRKAYGAALPVLRSLAERLGGEWLFGYADAARRVGALPDLIALLERQLADPALGTEAREQRATLLLESAGPVRALPVLKQLATGSVGGPWDSLYRETLAKLGRKDELRRYLLARAADERLAPKDRRDVASALIELGDKAGAEQALRRLAAAQGPQSDDYKQLLFLWGPRPPAEALNWIEARAKAAAAPADQAAWYASLAELGGARRVTETLGSAGTPEAPALKTPYIEALAAEGKAKELAEAVRSALATERAPDRLRRYARLAEQVRERKTAADAWTVLLGQKPDDAEALRQLGMLAYDENRLEDAERLLRRFVARSPDDYEAYYFLGEALTALKRPTLAVPFYHTALAQLRAGRTRNDATTQTEANLLNRLGKLDESVALFENLRKRRPNDRQLKADYASMLIENGRLQEARRVLSLQ